MELPALQRQVRRKSLIVIAIVLAAVVISAFALTEVANNSSTSTSSGKVGQTVFLDMWVVDNYGTWKAPYETPSSIVSLIQSFRNATAGRAVSLFAFLDGPQLPEEAVDGVALDTWLLQVKQAAGGDIIPKLDMDFYLSGWTNITTKSYCDPRNATNCGPPWFFQVSREFLSLQAIRGGSKTIYLGAWDTFSRYMNQSMIQSVLNDLHLQGWTYIMLHEPGRYFPDYGFGWGGVASAKNTSNWSDPTPPYLNPNINVIGLLHSAGEYAFVEFDRQNQPASKPPPALAYFLGALDSDQEAETLRNVAGLQASGGFTFIYPVLSYTNYAGTYYIWDATTSLQTNGRPFIELIETLVNANSASITEGSSSV